MSAGSAPRCATSELAAARMECLRTLLAIVFDRDQAMRLLGSDLEAAVWLSPGSVYRVLAGVALSSEPAWRRCACQIELALGQTEGSAPTHGRELSDHCECMGWEEVAGLLWARLKTGSGYQSIAS